MIDSSTPGIHACQCVVCQSGSDGEGMLSLEPDSPSDSALARITGLSRKTIRRGGSEIETGLALAPSTRQRRPGGGRVAAEKKTRNWHP